MNEIEIERISKHFSVLQNPICLKIVFLLKEKDLYVYEIAEKMSITRSKVSKYLKMLRLIGLIDFRQEYRRRQYFVKRTDILDMLGKYGQLIQRTK